MMEESKDTPRKYDFWEASDEDKITLFKRIKNEIGVSIKAAEKDWWVCHVIHSIFQLRCAEALTFKGGTSLCKAWDITRRFSEDVDISFDKSFFGLGGDTRSQRDRIRKLARAYIENEVARELKVTLSVFGGWESEVKVRHRQDSDADPTVLLIPYRSLLPEDPYIKREVKVEFSCRSPREPRELRSVEPFAVRLSPLIDYPKTLIPTVSPRRTFLEKVFLLHEEFQKNYPRHKRMSRHLFDLYSLDKAGYARQAMADTQLYTSLVSHRSVFNAIRGIDYSRHTPELLSILPPAEVLPLWEEDYKTMQDKFIYGDSPSFSELMKSLQSIQDRLHEIKL